MQIKYMGNADVRRLEKGEHFNGRLNKDLALDRDIEWNWENNHVIDTSEYASVDDEFWTLLLEEKFPDIEGAKGGPEFKDVTDLKRIPLNAAQKMWRAGSEPEEVPQPSGPRQSEADTEAAIAGGGTAAKPKATASKAT